MKIVLFTDDLNVSIVGGGLIKQAASILESVVLIADVLTSYC